MPGAPESEQQTACDDERDTEHEPSIRREVEALRRRLPSREPHAGDAKHAAGHQAPNRVSQGAVNPDRGHGSGQHEYRAGYSEADDVDRSEPAARTLTRDAHPIPLQERNRDQRHEGEDDEHRDNQQRHTSAYAVRVWNRELVRERGRYFFLLGSSDGLTYVTANGPTPWTWIVVSPFAIA